MSPGVNSISISLCSSIDQNKPITSLTSYVPSIGFCALKSIWPLSSATKEAQDSYFDPAEIRILARTVTKSPGENPER